MFRGLAYEEQFCVNRLTPQTRLDDKRFAASQMHTRYSLQRACVVFRYATELLRIAKLLIKRESAAFQRLLILIRTDARRSRESRKRNNNNVVQQSRGSAQGELRHNAVALGSADVIPAASSSAWIGTGIPGDHILTNEEHECFATRA